MGRINFFRQRILTQAASLECKGLFNYLLSEIKIRREISLEEAVLVARDVYHYLQTQLLERAPAQVVFPAIKGKETHNKRPRANQLEKMITLTVFDEEDIELMAEFGIAVMQRGRLCRLIEEACNQDAILDGPRLLLFILESHRGIRAHLKKLWEAGALLPVAGMSKANRELMQKPRAALAVERYLAGEDLNRVREDLALSSGRWQQLFNDFKTLSMSRQNTIAECSPKSGYPPAVLEAWQKLWTEHSDLLSARVITEKESFSQDNLYERLMKRHGYSPAAAEQFIEDLHQLAAHLNRQNRSRTQIVYNAVADDEPAGKKLSECRLKAVLLDYITPEDIELADRENPAKLKWARLVRFATEARYQGAVLTQPDLALLLGLSTKAIQSLLKAHPEVVVPTRGLVADMGPSLSHADKIIDLFMNGYTETEIKRRTGHSYDSLEKYILDYAKIVYLLNQGMPAPAIRKVLGFSRKLVDKYIKLYREYCGPEYAFMSGKLRRLAEAHPVKKNNKEE